MKKNTLVAAPPFVAAAPTRRLIRSTTVLCVRRDGKVVMAGDGQVTLGESVIKHARKRSAGFTRTRSWPALPVRLPMPSPLFADSNQSWSSTTGIWAARQSNWPRTGAPTRFLRHLEALLLVADKKPTFLISGHGDVIEPDERYAAIGSGGPYALAAAQALAEHTSSLRPEIAEEAMLIAGQMCIYTNDKVTIEEL